MLSRRYTSRAWQDLEQNTGALCLNVISAMALANNLETPFSSKFTVHFRVSDGFEAVQGLGRWLSQRSVCFVSMKTHIKPPEPTLKTRYSQVCSKVLLIGELIRHITGHAATLHPQDAGGAFLSPESRTVLMIQLNNIGQGGQGVISFCQILPRKLRGLRIIAMKTCSSRWRGSACMPTRKCGIT